jgi:Tol biopolymer transport system component
MEDVQANWSRDGKWVYFSSRRTTPWQLWKVNASGVGPEIQVTRNGAWVSRESFDATMLYYTKSQEEPTLWQMPLPGGEETQILDVAVGAGWTVAGKNIYFLNSSGTGAERLVTLERFDPKTRRREVVMAMPRGTRPNLGMLAVSPDEQWVLFTRDEVIKSELMLIENFR